jgi:hypothetical protein
MLLSHLGCNGAVFRIRFLDLMSSRAGTLSEAACSVFSYIRAVL